MRAGLVAAILLISIPAGAARLTCAQERASGVIVTVGGDEHPLTGRYVRCGLVGVPAGAQRAVIGLEASERRWQAESPYPVATGDTVEFWFTLYPSGDYPICAPETAVVARAFNADGATVAEVEQRWRQTCAAARDHGAVWDDDILSRAPRSSRALVDRVASAVVDGNVEALTELIPADGLRLGRRRVSADEARRILGATGVALTGIAPTCSADDEPTRCRFGPWTIHRVAEGAVWAAPKTASTDAPIRCLVFVRGETGWRWAGIDHFMPGAAP